MKITKTQLKEMVQEAIRGQLNEMSTVDTRMSQLNRLQRETGLNSFEVLEDILEQMDSTTWKLVLEGLKHKYGYRR